MTVPPASAFGPEASGRSEDKAEEIFGSRYVQRFAGSVGTDYTPMDAVTMDLEMPRLDGLGGAAASGRFLESLLFGLQPTEPRAIAAASVLMLSVALAAAYVPARRASRIDPLSALRAE